MMKLLFSFCLLCVFNSLAFNSARWKRTTGWSQLCSISTAHDDFNVFQRHVMDLKDTWNATPIPATEEMDYDLSVKPSFTPEPNDEIVLEVTKRWVQAMIADFAVCPFTVESDRAGIPRGAVRYTISRATTLVEALQAYWEEAHAMAQATTKDISTVLLVFPEVTLFGYDCTQFDRYSQTLEETLSPENPLGLDAYMNNVYFHPEFKFKDKFDQVHFIFNDEGEVIGTTEDLVLPHNYARRYCDHIFVTQPISTVHSFMHLLNTPSLSTLSITYQISLADYQHPSYPYGTGCTEGYPRRTCILYK